MTVFIVVHYEAAAAKNDYRSSTTVDGVYSSSEGAEQRAVRLTNLRTGNIASVVEKEVLP